MSILKCWYVTNLFKYFNFINLRGTIFLGCIKILDNTSFALCVVTAQMGGLPNSIGIPTTVDSISGSDVIVSHVGSECFILTAWNVLHLVASQCCESSYHWDEIFGTQEDEDDRQPGMFQPCTACTVLYVLYFFLNEVV